MSRRKIVFGLNLSHDESCAALVDGELKVAIENERLSRLKHNEGRSDFGKIIPFPSIRYCCDFLKITPADVDLYVVNSVLRGARELAKAQLLGIPERRVIDMGVPGHHAAHAQAAFFGSPFDNSAVIVVDTNGGYDYRRSARDQVLPWSAAPLRQENYSIYHGSGRRLKAVAKDWIRPGEIGIGQLYMLFAAILQLTPRERGYFGKDCALAAGGKLMGYAAWDHGNHNVPALFPGQGAHLAVKARDFIAHCRQKGLLAGRPSGGLDSAWAHQLQRIAPFKTRTGNLRERRYIALAGEAQRLLESAMMRIALIAREKTGCANVCFSGGSALNFVATTKILESGVFKDAFTHSAPHDAGNAIGAALYGHFELGGRRPTARFSPYLGREYSNTDVEDAIWQGLNKGRFQYEKLDDARQIRVAINYLKRGKIIAICKGRSEFGPRALGNRSLLASASNPKMRDALNRIKGREWYRPVAPVVVEEHFLDWFSAPLPRSPHMTVSARVRDDVCAQIPAVRHADGSARVQTVTAEQNRFLHSLLTGFGRMSGVPVLINTSFNIGGEPIVETPIDAIKTFLAAEGVDCLLLGRYCLTKSRRRAIR